MLTQYQRERLHKIASNNALPWQESTTISHSPAALAAWLMDLYRTHWGVTVEVHVGDAYLDFAHPTVVRTHQPITVLGLPDNIIREYVDAMMEGMVVQAKCYSSRDTAGVGDLPIWYFGTKTSRVDHQGLSHDPSFEIMGFRLEKTYCEKVMQRMDKFLTDLTVNEMHHASTEADWAQVLSSISYKQRLGWLQNPAIRNNLEQYQDLLWRLASHSREWGKQIRTHLERLGYYREIEASDDDEESNDHDFDD